MFLNTLLLQAQMIPGLGTAGSEAGKEAAGNVGKLAADVAELKTLSLNDLIRRLSDSAVSFAINLAIAILVFYVGRFIIRKIHGLVGAIFLKRGIERSLSTFVLSLLNMTLYFILIVTVIGILGIETTSFLALFASAGVAVGMALSGTLQNFAGGVLILLLKPYKVGDYIEAQGYAGTVKEIQIFFTVITTPDNKSISIPNGGLSTGSVNNWTREEFRRVSWTVSISYGDDVEAARKAILDMFDSDSRIIKAADPALPAASAPDESLSDKPGGDGDGDVPARNKKTHSLFGRVMARHRRSREAIALHNETIDARLAALTPRPDFTPKVMLGELAASSVDLHVRAWTRTADYWGVFYHYNERFYNELPGHDISFPFPQMDVHMKRE